jgi:GrpB-like predicted nucleotidyltransferase (UPF0157 family)
VTDHVEIVSYEPAWPAQFVEERQQLLIALPDAEAIEHIGSTSVPGLPAKPVIDILIVVRSLDSARAAFPTALDRLDYAFWHNNPKPDRLFLVTASPARGLRRTHHIHVFEDTDTARDHLRFRGCAPTRISPPHTKH